MYVLIYEWILLDMYRSNSLPNAERVDKLSLLLVFAISRITYSKGSKLNNAYIQNYCLKLLLIMFFDHGGMVQSNTKLSKVLFLKS